MENIIGELTALAAAFAYSLASISYTLAGRKFGASASMALSLVISLAFLLPAHRAVEGGLFPLDTSAERWWWLGLSSLAGFVISALLLLRAFQYIGPRLTMLVGSTSPIYAAILAWLFLGEGLRANALLGIALVIGGVFWVVSDRPAAKAAGAVRDYRRGLASAIGASTAQGASFVLMSLGVAGGYSALSASLIRTLVALLLLLALIGLRGQLRRNLKLIAIERRALALSALAGLGGPVLGTTFVLISLQYTSVGISSTLTGTTPIMLIPLSFLVFGERVSWRAALGTAVAVCGVALLFAA